MTIPVTKYVSGKCFICGETKDMLPDGYAHYQCAIVYGDERKKEREAQYAEEKARDEAKKLKKQQKPKSTQTLNNSQ